MRVLTPFTLTLALAAAAALTGCASHEILPPTAHAPLSPTDVKIYQSHPRKYEQLGLVEVPITPDMRWDNSGDADKAFDALKAKAAAKGANGILFADVPHQVTVTAGYHGTFYQLPCNSNPKTALAMAVYVHQAE